ncbi:MAG: hypothetical protein WDZ51_18865 [Pirellulaceae bacterium]
MKTIATLAVATILLSASTTFAGEPGAVSQDSLSKFGLSGMKVATPAQAEQVRGMGYASVSGYSFSSAALGSVREHNFNKYTASSDQHRALAKGNSQSTSGLSIGGEIGGSYSNFNLGSGGLSFSTGSFNLYGGIQVTAFGGGSAFAYAR